MSNNARPHNRKVWTWDLVNEEVNRSGEYILLSNTYKHCEDELIVKHLKTGEIHTTNLHKWMSNKRPHRNTKLLVTQDVINKSITSEGYVVLENYISSNKKFKVMCPKYHTYKTTWSNWYQNYRCPICNESKGEKQIAEVLCDMEYSRQYRFPDCRNVYPLPFDFAVFYNGNLKGVIEYQGEQHYRPIDHFGGVDSFEKTKVRDQIKIDYCKKNNIPLLVIPYTEEDILASVNRFIGEINDK